MNQYKTGDQLVVREVSSQDQEMAPLVERIYELGVYPGITIEILHQIQNSHITVIGFNETVIALNQSEFLCLKF